MSWIIREERAGDADAIRTVVKAAFRDHPHSDGTESDIVDRLRHDSATTLSLVAEEHGEVLGHIAFSPVSIDGMDCGWLGLGPLSVTPGVQGKGIGTALVREGLERLAARGAMGCVVLGDPDYYGRFGFIADPTLTFAGVPPEYFQRLLLAGDPPRGEVRYAPAFG